MRNYIGLDISKVSTAMVIESNLGESFWSYNTKKLNSKWNTIASNCASIKTYIYETSEIYSDSEILKLKIYIKIANDILKDILINIDSKEETIVNIEGYSYSQNAGPIIDLVGIGSIIRAKLFESIDNVSIIITAPKSLKTQLCELVYGYSMVTKGKRKKKIVKEINRNKKGTAGGAFDKWDIFNALMDYKPTNILYIQSSIYHDDITAVKSFPKPFEDINDAYFLKELIINNKYI